MSDDVYECFERILKNRKPPKTEPMIDGHSDISVTLNTYTHLKLDDAREEMEALKAAAKEVRPIKNRLKQAKIRAV